MEEPEKSADEFLNDFWKYCEEWEKKEEILEKFRKQLQSSLNILFDAGYSIWNRFKIGNRIIVVLVV